MKNLLYKEFTLSINKFFYVLPVLTGALVLIPQWTYLVAFMYFLWIAAPQIYATYKWQFDYSFSMIMPIRKQDLVVSKYISFMSMEILFIIIGAIYTIIHHHYFGVSNFLLDMNMAFYGFVFIAFAIFNFAFFPEYFKTAFNYGLPMVIGNVLVLGFLFLVEWLNIKNHTINQYLEGVSKTEVTCQFVILIVGIIIFFCSLLTMKLSIKRFEKVEL